MLARSIALASVGVAAVLGACHDNSDSTGPDSLFYEVRITPSTTNLGVGNTVLLHASVTGPPGTPQGVIWRAMDPEIATVSGVGLVTAQAGGTGRIRAMWVEDTTNFTDAFINVTVGPIQEQHPEGAERQGE